MAKHREIQEKAREELEQIAADRPFTEKQPLAPPDATYTISARGKPTGQPVFNYLRHEYGNVALAEIDSLFGFVEQSTLYGGRNFVQREISDRDVIDLTLAGIGLRIPMTNHFVEREEYEQNLPLLEKYHSPLNSIIVTNDTLAEWIRQDFPHYQLDASVIKNIKTLKKIDKALELYDSVVLPMKINEDLEFLETIEVKEKIILFANAGCALTCTSKLCYRSISMFNKGQEDDFECSLLYKNRKLRGMVDFALQPFIDRGFHRFKLLRARPGGITGF